MADDKEKGRVYDFETQEEITELPPEVMAIKDESLNQLKLMLEQFENKDFGPQEKTIIVSVLSDQCEQITELFLILEFSPKDRMQFIEMMKYMIEQAMRAIEVANNAAKGEMQ